VPPADVYVPDQWTGFFTLVGTGAAALTGLVFVAVTINLSGIAKDATHKYRAINMLSGFTSVFVVSAFALMGHQTHVTFGIAWLVVALLAAAINTNGYVQAFRVGGSSLYALSLFRIVGASVCYIGQVVGAVILIAGSRSGLYVAAVSLVANFYFLVSGSWLLILGTFDAAHGSLTERS
jgi:hypothetical protein